MRESTPSREPGAEAVGARPDGPRHYGSYSCDFAVVGAGILGLATARELQRRWPGRRVTVLEREDRIGAHQTTHNSGVIHAGVYYAPGSLKARMCVAGARAMYEFCERHGIEATRSGKLIVAASEAELGPLDELEQRARANGVEGLRRLTAAQIADVEPHARGVAALHSPNTGVVDFGLVADALAREFREAGGELLLGWDVSDVAAASREITLRAGGGDVLSAGFLVSCAGAWSDRLAVAAGASPDPRIVPFRGGYLKLAPERRELVRSLIYPVPDPRLPFLGVHLTRHADGEVLVGPTALLVGARDAYSLRRVRWRDLRATLGWPGTWRVMRRFWRTGLTEISHAVSVKALAAASRRYVPELRDEDFLPGPSGIRAQAVARDGKLVDDFVVSRTERALHVRNAPSPAATSSLALASLIADEVQAAL